MNTIVVTVREANTVSVSKHTPALTTVINQPTVATIVPPPLQVSELSQQVNSLQVVEIPRGPAGPRGVAGADAGGNRPAFTLSHGDATPAPVQNLGAVPVEVMRVSIEVEVPFDALNPRLALGTADAPEAFVPYLPGLLSSAGICEFTPRVEAAANTEVIATLLHDAAGTQGRVQVVITTSPLT